MVFHQPSNSVGNYHYNDRIYSNHEYAPHFHKNLEIIFVQNGFVNVTVNGVPETISSNEAALVLSNQIHAFSVPNESVARVVVFSEDYVPSFSGLIKGKQGKTCRFVPDPSVLALVNQNLFGNDTSILMKKACLYALCGQYAMQTELEIRQEKSNFIVGQLLDWIATNYTDNITLRQAAETFGYEYHYLSRLLNKNYAIRFSTLLNAYRVERAMNLLRETDISVSDVAEASGFQSIRSFNLCFREMTGQTPCSYRHNR